MQHTLSKFFESNCDVFQDSFQISNFKPQPTSPSSSTSQSFSRFQNVTSKPQLPLCLFSCLPLLTFYSLPLYNWQYIPLCSMLACLPPSYQSVFQFFPFLFMILRLMVPSAWNCGLWVGSAGNELTMRENPDGDGAQSQPLTRHNHTSWQIWASSSRLAHNLTIGSLASSAGKLWGARFFAAWQKMRLESV